MAGLGRVNAILSCSFVPFRRKSCGSATDFREKSYRPKVGFHFRPVPTLHNPHPMHATGASLVVRAVSVALLLAYPQAPAQAGTADIPPAVRAKPDADARRCLAATRRVERQRDIVTQTDARIEREQSALASCNAKRSCDRHERALNASGMRQHRHQKQLAQFKAEAEAACTRP